MSLSDGYAALYAADVSVLSDPRLYEAAYAGVSAARREKADRYYFAKDRYLSIGAEVLLRHAIRAEGICESSVVFSYGEHGKPYLADADVFFSLSHSGDFAVCAVSNREAGCDVEKIAAANIQVAKRFFCGTEYEDIASQPTQKARDDMFYRYWTLKESFIKATGLGMKLSLNSFQIVRGSGISVVQSVDGRDYRFAEFNEIPGYKCALCTAGECGKTAFYTVDLRQIWEDSPVKALTRKTDDNTAG